MIISRITGGLGNQMFQYAAGRTISIKHNIPFKIDISFFDNPKQNRHFLLDTFNIKAEIATKKEIIDFNGEKKDLLPKKYFRIIRNTLQKRIYRENRFSYSDTFLSIKKNTYIKGLFQSEKYFSSIKNLIKNEFSLRKPLSHVYDKHLKSINSNNSISLHIRRGDYVNNKKTSDFHGNLNIKYYTQAAEMIEKRIQNPHFYIFSDDIDWAKKNLMLNHPITFMADGNELNCYEEMYLMSTCKHNIIANSTFSWWGAWLNNNSNKIIIAPKKWFAQAEMNNQTQDLLPASWIRI